MKNWKSKTMIALSLTVLLAGCGSGGSTGTSGTSTDTAASGSKTVRLGTWEDNTGVEVQKKIADEFMKKNPDIKVVIEPSPDQYGTKLLTQIAAGDAPDVMQLGDADIRKYAETGAIANLTEFVKREGMNLDDYFQPILDVGKVDGTLYALPKDYSNLAIYYNKKHFDEAGIPYPKEGWTWDEFYKTAQKLTVKKGEQFERWGVNLPGAWLRGILPIIYAYGGDVISKDGKSMQGVLNSEGTVKALEFYRNMYFGGTVAPSATDTQALKGVDLFQTGRVSMSMTGRWPIRVYNEDKNFSYGTVALPVGTNGPANTICYAGFALYNKSKVKDAAWKYLKFLGGPEGQKVFSTHAFTALKSVADEVGQTKNPDFKGFMDGIPHVKPLPEGQSANFPKATTDAIQPVLDKIILKNPIDIKKELDNAVKLGEPLLQK